MDESKVYDRDDNSAWGGDGHLAYLCGVLFGTLARENGLAWERVEYPSGYAPVIDLITHHGRRFRLRIEAVPAEEK